MTCSSRRWFHHHLTGVDSERLLMDKGVSGSFLARPSNSTKGSFTLSVRRGDEVTHIKIQNTDDFLDLYGGEKFATLAELVKYYMDNDGQLREKNGDLIELKYPLCSEDPTTERWFHGNINGKEAEKMLSERGRTGSFLVRESIHRPDSYVLSVLTGENRVAHVMIYRKPDGKFDVGGGSQFTSLKALIDFYSATPMVEKSGGVVSLKQPFNATRVSASTIEHRMVQLEKENGRSGDGRAGFWEEFEELQQEAQNKSYSRKEGMQPYNRDKNRYKNILPFDDTRVKLNDGDPSVLGTDYINANYITCPTTENELGTDVVPITAPTRRYVATQGTLHNTLTDFWRMVWQEKTRVIVMITKEVERGRNKCVRYWPTPEEGSREFPAHGGAIRVAHVTERQSADYTLRELLMTRADGENKGGWTVYHFHFTVWPDHGTPSDPSSVLNFLHDINARQGNVDDAGPIVVHCSAGIGRTGTLIVIDMVITQIKQQGLTCDIDISRTIQMVRDQRSGMVQTEAQYKFIYKAVQHYIDTVSKRIQLDNNLRNTGRDYTNINRAADDLGGDAASAVVPPTPSAHALTTHETGIVPTLEEPLRTGDIPALPPRRTPQPKPRTSKNSP